MNYINPKKATTIILILAIIIAVVFAFFYFFKKQDTAIDSTEKEIITKPTVDPNIEIQRKGLEALREKYKVDNNSDEQLKRQHEKLNEK